MPLDSWQFFLLASVAILVVPVARGWWRIGVFLALNLTFAWTYWGLRDTPVALGLCVAGYLGARLARGRNTSVLVTCVGLLTVAFVYLRGYSFAAAVFVGPPAASGALAFAGLSFMFFKIVHVVIDSAAGTIERLSFRHYLNYCLCFTTLLMGPIQRYQDFVAQWTGEVVTDPPTFERHLDAANRVVRGLVKAFALAPIVAPFILRPGLPIEQLAAGDLLLRIYAFYVYLYLDFSGYCDIVIGVGSLMGLRPPENFHFPFLARDVSAYWLRVHRSLTVWLTDYVFTPVYRLCVGHRILAGHAFAALALSLIVTMVVAGIWHGTTPNFVAFGVVHGIALAVARGYEHGMIRWMGRPAFRRFSERPAVTVVAVCLTYNFTSLAYTFFVLNLHDSVRVFARLTAALRLA